MNQLFRLAKVSGDIEHTISKFSINSVLIASLLLVVLLLVSSKVIKIKKFKKLKKPLFILIAITVIVPTLSMTGSTIYLNTISDSNGPVHWHTDIELWVCNTEIELRDPTSSFSNKIGTSTYHEHDDKRIHLEGVVVDTSYDASLEKFFDVTGGELSASRMRIPTEESIFDDDVDGDKVGDKQTLVREFMVRDDESRAMIDVANGDSCGIEAENAEVQGFLISYNKEDDTYTQTKMENPQEYVMRDESLVPPGDCIILEFDALKSRTDKLCQQYGIRDRERCVSFGVSEFNPKLCNIRETTVEGGDQ